MANIRNALEQLNRKKLAKRLAVGPKAISAACVRGKFPSSWYLVVQAMATEGGIDVPDEMFRWKPTDNPTLAQHKASPGSVVVPGRHTDTGDDSPP